MVTKRRKHFKRQNKRRSYKKGGMDNSNQSKNSLKVYRINVNGESVKKGMPGADYLRDSNNIVYNANTGEEIGIWNGTQIVFNTYDSEKEFYDSEEESVSSLNSTPESESSSSLISLVSSDNNDKQYTELLKKYNSIKPIYEKMSKFIKYYNMFNQSYKINNDEIINID